MSKRDRVAAIFRRYRRKKVSALVLVKAGGLLAWRTEVSRCRTQLGMRIEWIEERTRDGQVRSFYRYVGKKAA